MNKKDLYCKGKNCPIMECVNRYNYYKALIPIQPEYNVIGGKCRNLVVRHEFYVDLSSKSDGDGTFLFPYNYKQFSDTVNDHSGVYNLKNCTTLKPSEVINGHTKPGNSKAPRTSCRTSKKH